MTRVQVTRPFAPPRGLVEPAAALSIVMRRVEWFSCGLASRPESRESVGLPPDFSAVPSAPCGRRDGPRVAASSLGRSVRGHSVLLEAACRSSRPPRHLVSGIDGPCPAANITSSTSTYTGPQGGAMIALPKGHPVASICLRKALLVSNDNVRLTGQRKCPPCSLWFEWSPPWMIRCRRAMMVGW